MLKKKTSGREYKVDGSFPATSIVCSSILGENPCAEQLMTNYLGGKFAPVAPAHIYNAMFNRGYVPSTVLLLAHDVVKKKEEYYNTFKRFKGTIIMDNSLVENGMAVDFDMVYTAVEVVNAPIAVLPDVLNDGFDSSLQTVAAWDRWKRDLPGTKLMAVLQGKSVDDFFRGAEYIKNNIDPDWISVPRCIQGIDGKDRSWYVNWANTLFPDKPIHLLGQSDFIWEDIVAASLPAVKSIDSAAPLRVPAQHLLSIDAGPRGDWWDTAVFEQNMIDSCVRMDSLIRAAA